MRIIISDSSCLIDLHKGGLLVEIFSLPFTVMMPQPLFDTELLSIPMEDKKKIVELGMRVEILPGEHVSRAMTFLNEHRPLVINDCFALVLAEVTEESILLTGDNPLRNVAQSMDIETHGVLWVVDMLLEHTDIDPQLLLDALLIYEGDTNVWLPGGELRTRIKTLRKLCR